MKTLYPNRMHNAHAKNVKDSRKKTILFFLFIALTIFAFAGGAPKLDFKSAQPDSILPDANLSIYPQQNVNKDIKALIAKKKIADWLQYNSRDLSE